MPAIENELPLHLEKVIDNGSWKRRLPDGSTTQDLALGKSEIAHVLSKTSVEEFIYGGWEPRRLGFGLEIESEGSGWSADST